MGSGAEAVWSDCLKIIRDILPSDLFTHWFVPISAESLEGRKLTLRVPSQFYYEYLEEHYYDLLSKVLRRVIGDGAKLQYRVVMAQGQPGRSSYTTTVPSVSSQGSRPQTVSLTGSVTAPTVMNPFLIPGIRQLQIDPQLQPEYCFDNFVKGPCNRIAFEAGRAVAQNLSGSTALNPLIIHGASGLGKTHLAQSIGLAVRELHPQKVVLYVRATEFMTQFVSANERKTVNDFINFYQNIHLLIVDDVHELASRTGTQEVLFGIFNHLHLHNHQLIFTSDRPPVDLKGIKHELLSRFKWGLSAELEPPDFDTRLAILQAKNRRDGNEHLSDEVLRYIAKTVVTNVRELEGALISVMAHSTFDKQEITLELAQRVISKIVTPPQSREITVERIVEYVGRYYNLSIEELNAPNRRREVVQPRQVAMYLSKKYTHKSLNYIGQQIGGKNHATVLHACKTISDLCDSDKRVRRDLIEIERLIDPTS